MIRRDVNPETDDVIVSLICDACGEEGHDAPRSHHDADGELLSTREINRRADNRPDPLVAAVIAREVAEDEFFARSYSEFVRMQNFGFGHGAPTRAEVRKWVEQAQNAMIDARMAAMLEADAAGLINLFDKGGDAELRTVEIMRFSGMTAENAAAAHA